jgi:hypothetical protein
MAISFIGGQNRSTQRKPPTCHKSLTTDKLHLMLKQKHYSITEAENGIISLAPSSIPVSIVFQWFRLISFVVELLECSFFFHCYELCVLIIMIIVLRYSPTFVISTAIYNII